MATGRCFFRKSDKLRHSFNAESPICHLFGTVFFAKRAYGRQCLVSIIGFGLEFLQPWTLVEVRLEASASQHLLSKGAHEKLLVVPEWVQPECGVDTTVFESFLTPSETDTTLTIRESPLQPVPLDENVLLF